MKRIWINIGQHYTHRPTSGEYTIKANSGAPDEQGDCAFKNGKVCDAQDYFNGECSPDN
ncbi:MAG: hypothetical protein WBD56_02750 [Anaerolineales bacterium]